VFACQKAAATLSPSYRFFRAPSQAAMKNMYAFVPYILYAFVYPLASNRAKTTDFDKKSQRYDCCLISTARLQKSTRGFAEVALFLSVGNRLLPDIWLD